FPNFNIAATPTLNMLSPNTLSISGGNTVEIAPSLIMSGNVLTVGPPNNTITVPTGTFVTTNIVPQGVLTSTASGNTFSLNVPASNIAITNTAGSAGVSTVSPNNFNINIPSPDISVTSTVGAAQVATVSPNVYNINIPPSSTPSITPEGVLTQTTSGSNFTLAVAPTNVS